MLFDYKAQTAHRQCNYFYIYLVQVYLDSASSHCKLSSPASFEMGLFNFSVRFDNASGGFWTRTINLLKGRAKVV